MSSMSLAKDRLIHQPVADLTPENDIQRQMRVAGRLRAYVQCIRHHSSSHPSTINSQHLATYIQARSTRQVYD
jgi:hypothetical protein